MKARTNQPPLTKEGLELISGSTVVICGIARDCASQLSKLIPKLENLAAKFKNYKIIVVENDSQDNTAKVIALWAASNRNVIPIVYSGVDLNLEPHSAAVGIPGDFDLARISRIAFARNIYLRELQQHHPADFIIIVDLDIMDFSIRGIANSFGQCDEWDCATSSGLRYTLRTPFRSSVYWDTFAYEPKEGFAGGVQSPADIYSNQKKLRDRVRHDELVPARSAFGGLAIYRYQSLLNHEYEVLTNRDPGVPVFCEHVALHRSIARENSGFRLVINPFQELHYESPVTTISRNLYTLLLKGRM